jgi:cytochrome b561
LIAKAEKAAAERGDAEARPRQLMIGGLLALMAFDIGAALFHEFGLRDDVLRRMLPWTARDPVESP